MKIIKYSKCYSSISIDTLSFLLGGGGVHLVVHEPSLNSIVNLIYAGRRQLPSPDCFVLWEIICSNWSLVPINWYLLIGIS